MKSENRIEQMKKVYSLLKQVMKNWSRHLMSPSFSLISRRLLLSWIVFTIPMPLNYFASRKQTSVHIRTPSAEQHTKRKQLNHSDEQSQQTTIYYSNAIYFEHHFHLSTIRWTAKAKRCAKLSIANLCVHVALVCLHEFCILKWIPSATLTSESLSFPFSLCHYLIYCLYPLFSFNIFTGSSDWTLPKQDAKKRPSTTSKAMHLLAKVKYLTSIFKCILQNNFCLILCKME